MKTSAIERLWTIDDVADFCRVERSIVKYWLYNSDLPRIKLGKQIRFDRNDVMEWVGNQKKGINNKTPELKSIN